MRVANRFVIMLRKDLESPRYEDQWPIIFIRDEREDARALCGTTYVRVNRTVSRNRFDAIRVDPCSLEYAGDKKSYPGGVYRLDPI